MNAGKDSRRNIKAIAPVKADIESIRTELGLKSESQVLAYLTAMYRDQKDKKITLKDHQDYMRHVEDVHMGN
ncbi:hypothetical protein [Paenibacillus brasilensis]|uniref:Uncharacterized protein n=1 Tax=Paenibacillus brasilensis TaxID=128574 RepID=A0ABU0L7J0_9BACL|nr:hypothetical protein [Paenibacillus brasilensis]MDQ0497253.1 hypothetical protein [Paenibacillus brasilensis]